MLNDGRSANLFQRNPFRSVTTTNTKTALSLFGNNKIPTINDWVLESDNGIQGLVSNSPDFEDGDNISTSPIVGVPGKNKVVTTVNGSKYRLGTPAGGSVRSSGRRRPRVNKGTIPISRAPVARSETSAATSESSSSGSSAVSFFCCDGTSSEMLICHQ